jgi:hypothetical protein
MKLKRIIVCFPQHHLADSAAGMIAEYFRVLSFLETKGQDFAFYLRNLLHQQPLFCIHFRNILET